MKAKKHMQKFFVKSWDTNGILVAFWPNSKASDKQNIKIADAIYHEFIKDDHLGLTDAETVYQYVARCNLDYNKDSLVICEFDKNDNLIENIFGEKIITSYEQAGSELRFYFNGLSNLAFTVSLKTSSIPKKALWWILIAILGIGVFYSIDKYLSLQTVREEKRQYEQVLLDSIEQERLKQAELNAKLDSISNLNAMINENWINSQVLIQKLQQELDSITKVLQGNEEDSDAPEQQSKSNKQKPSVATSPKSNNKPIANQTRTVSQDNQSKKFKVLVDRGNQFARSYHYNGSESDRIKAIKCYSTALEIRSDNEVRNKLSKLQKK